MVDRRSLVRASVAGLTIALAAAPVAVYLWIALHRLGYGYELDWMEGGSVGLAGRVLHGQSLYAAPSLAYVGWTYPPLYYWLSAALAKVVGLGFLPLRLLSFTASLVSMLCIGSLVARRSGDRVAGIVAGGLFAACYGLSGYWYDVGRVDSLFVALTLVALWWGADRRGVRGGLLLGLLAFLAVFTKQTAAIALAPPLLWLCLTRWRVGLSAVGVLAVLLGGSTLILDSASGAWYRYYVLSELTGQPWVRQLWVGFWRQDLLAHLWPAALLVGGATLGGGFLDLRSRKAPRVPVYELSGALGLIVAAYLSRLHTGGYLNVLIPAYAGVALLAGLAAGALRCRGTVAAVAVAALLALQLALLAYPVGPQLPTREDQTAGGELIARLRTLPGPVLVLTHPWYAAELGKGEFAQGEGITDVLRSHAARGRRALLHSLRSGLDALHINAVVTDGLTEGSILGPEFTREFKLQRGWVTAQPLEPLTDRRTSPAYVYVRRG